MESEASDQHLCTWTLRVRDACFMNSHSSANDLEGCSSVLGLYGIYLEKKMETSVLYWGYVGIMSKKMESTILY